MEKEYYFFIEKIGFNESSKVIIGYLFFPDGVVIKKRLYTSLFMFDRDKIKEFLLIKFTNFSYHSKKDKYAIFISNSDIVAAKQLYKEDYDKFRNKYFKKTLEGVEINPDLSEVELIEAKEEIERFNLIHNYYQHLEQEWEEDYVKKWVHDDTGGDSELNDYDSDGNYLYEDNSNPTNSNYFNKSDIDFLQNN